MTFLNVLFLFMQLLHMNGWSEAGRLVVVGSGLEKNALVGVVIMGRANAQLPLYTEHITKADILFYSKQSWSQFALLNYQ